MIEFVASFWTDMFWSGALLFWSYIWRQTSYSYHLNVKVIWTAECRSVHEAEVFFGKIHLLEGLCVSIHFVLISPDYTTWHGFHPCEMLQARQTFGIYIEEKSSWAPVPLELPTKPLRSKLAKNVSSKQSPDLKNGWNSWGLRNWWLLGFGGMCNHAIRIVFFGENIILVF